MKETKKVVFVGDALRMWLSMPRTCKKYCEYVGEKVFFNGPQTEYDKLVKKFYCTPYNGKERFVF